MDQHYISLKSHRFQRLHLEKQSYSLSYKMSSELQLTRFKYAGMISKHSDA